MAPMFGPEDPALVVPVVLVLVSIAAVVVEVEVEMEFLLVLLPSFPSIWKMVESRRSEKPFLGEV